MAEGVQEDGDGVFGCTRQYSMCMVLSSGLRRTSYTPAGRVPEMSPKCPRVLQVTLNSR
jgi:hypothetical protein